MTSGRKAKAERARARYADSIERLERLVRARRCLRCEARLDDGWDWWCRACADAARSRVHPIAVPDGATWIRYRSELETWATSEPGNEPERLNVKELTDVTNSR